MEESDDAFSQSIDILNQSNPELSICLAGLKSNGIESLNCQIIHNCLTEAL